MKEGWKEGRKEETMSDEGSNDNRICKMRSRATCGLRHSEVCKDLDLRKHCLHSNAMVAVLKELPDAIPKASKAPMGLTDPFARGDFL